METLDFLIFIVVADVALIMILDIRRSVINVRKEPYFVHFDSRFHTLNDVVENIVAYKCLRGQKEVVAILYAKVQRSTSWQHLYVLPKSFFGHYSKP